MTTKTKTKAAAEPTAKKTTPAPAPVSPDDIYDTELDLIMDALRDVAVTPGASPSDNVYELIAALNDATDKLTATISVLAGYFGEQDGKDPVRLAQNAVAYCRDLKATIEAGKPAQSTSCAAVGRILTETIISGRGDLQITIRPYAAPASTPTEADA